MPAINIAAVYSIMMFCNKYNYLQEDTSRIGIIVGLFLFVQCLFPFIYGIFGSFINCDESSEDLIKYIEKYSIENDDCWLIFGLRYSANFFSLAIMSVLLIPFGYAKFIKDKLFYFGLEKDEEKFQMLFTSQKEYDKLLIEEFNRKIGLIK